LKKKIAVLIMVFALLLSATLLASPIHSGYLATQSAEDLEHLVRTELGNEYIFVFYWPGIDPHAEYVATEHYFIRYNITGKGVTDMGDMFFISPLEVFVNKLASKSNPYDYLQQLREKLGNPTQYPHAHCIGGDTVDVVNVTLEPDDGVTYSLGFPSDTTMSHAMSVGLTSGDEACYTIIELRALRDSSVDACVWKRVLHFENTEGIPGHSLSLVGVGTTHQMTITNDDRYTQDYRIYRSRQVIP